MLHPGQFVQHQPLTVVLKRRKLTIVESIKGVVDEAGIVDPIRSRSVDGEGEIVVRRSCSVESE